MSGGECRGVGIGLRPVHLHDVAQALSAAPCVAPWFEVHICNFLGGGLNQYLLSAIAERYPLSAHGVNLNLGGIEPLDSAYLQQLKAAVDRFKPALVSEHACFNNLGGYYFHDLLPIPYTEEAAKHMAGRITQVQDYLQREILIENVSRYFCYPESQMSEGQFLAAVCDLSGCGLLLDLNNAYVNQYNLAESVEHFMAALPVSRIAEVHLAGFSEQQGRLLDTHNQPVSSEVWALLKQYAELLSPLPCLIEWDSDIPSLPVLLEEAAKADSILSAVGQGQGQGLNQNQDRGQDRNQRRGGSACTI